MDDGAARYPDLPSHLVYLFSLLIEYIHTVIRVVTHYDVLFSGYAETVWNVCLFTIASKSFKLRNTDVCAEFQISRGQLPPVQ